MLLKPNVVAGWLAFRLRIREVWFKPRPRDQLSWQVFSGFPLSLQTDARMVRIIKHAQGTWETSFVELQPSNKKGRTCYTWTHIHTAVSTMQSRLHSEPDKVRGLRPLYWLIGVTCLKRLLVCSCMTYYRQSMNLLKIYIQNCRHFRNILLSGLPLYVEDSCLCC